MSVFFSSFMTKRIVMMFATVVLLGGGCAGGVKTTLPTLGYTLPSDGSITVTSAAVNGEDIVKADALLAQAAECGYSRSASYYLDTAALFTGEKGTRYTFTIAGNYEMPTWTVTVLPNAATYSSLEGFKTDFDICAAGGDLYPSKVSPDSLMFIAGCGSGYSDGKKNGCDAIRTAVESTLTIK